MSLLNIFKKQEQEEIKLYCQNPQCKNPEISKEDYVTKVNDALVHSTQDCFEGYMCHEVFNSSNGFYFCSNKKTMSYHKAEKLARKDKIKFNKLEKRMTSIGGMKQ
ncbi:hypothetical protein M0R72_04480 [Candidatus Pacearchaeota archaeon]|jgi:hypothetical protein|nr:hypothetical protein [Candidatus Pacearchaeota archaeon]